MGTYIELFKLTFKNSVVYRFNIWSRMVGDVIFIIMWIFFWKALYGGNAEIANVSFTSALSYLLVTQMLISMFNTAYPMYRIESLVRDGRIGMELLRPYNFAVRCLAEDLGNVASYFLFSAFPIFIVVSLLNDVSYNLSIMNIIGFLISVTLGFLVKYIIELSVGLLAFKFVEVKMQGIINFTISLLAGASIPLWFFPSGLREIAMVLPFRGIYFNPSAILIGELSGEELMKALVIQFIWVVILSLILSMAWKKVNKLVAVQGG